MIILEYFTLWNIAVCLISVIIGIVLDIYKFGSGDRWFAVTFYALIFIVASQFLIIVLKMFGV